MSDFTFSWDTDSRAACYTLCDNANNIIKSKELKHSTVLHMLKLPR